MEGIVIDPIGAVIAVLIFEQIILPQPAPGEIILGIIKTILIGVGMGYVSAKVLIESFRRYWCQNIYKIRLY